MIHRTKVLLLLICLTCPVAQVSGLETATGDLPILINPRCSDTLVEPRGIERAAYTATYHLINESKWTPETAEESLTEIGVPHWITEMYVDYVLKVKKRRQTQMSQYRSPLPWFNEGSLIVAARDYRIKYPNFGKDRKWFDDVLNSKFSNEFKLILIDGVIGYSPKPGWPEGPLLAPLDQLAYWETQHNPFGKRTSAGVQFALKAVPNARLKIETVVEEDHEVIKRFLTKDGAEIPVHPIAHEILPFSDLPTVGHAAGKFTSSRSTFFETVSLKIPSTYASPLHQDSAISSKPNQTTQLPSAIFFSRQIARIEAKYGAHEKLLILRDTASFTDTKTGNGILIRDLRPLQNGNYYLPGSSMFSEAGKAIAAKSGKKFGTFWREAFAYATGYGKGVLLARYSLQGVNSHEQQWLVELTPDLVPTGRIVLRDATDLEFVLSNAELYDPEGLKLAYDSSETIVRNFTDHRLFIHGDRFSYIRSDESERWDQRHADGIRDGYASITGVHP